MNPPVDADAPGAVDVVDLALSIAVDVDLPPLPEKHGQDRLEGILEALLVIAGNELDAMGTAPEERGEEPPQVNVGLGGIDADAEGGALANASPSLERFHDGSAASGRGRGQIAR